MRETRITDRFSQKRLIDFPFKRVQRCTVQKGAPAHDRKWETSVADAIAEY